MTWRVFWFLIRLGAIGALAVFFARNPGRISIDWQGWAIDVPVGIAVLIIFLVVLMILYTERLRQSLFLFPSRWRAHRKAIRDMKGYRALTLGMVAIAAGEQDESRRQSRRARDLLGDAPLTKLLQAQSARLQGDEKIALACFENMRGDPEVAFLGLRGLMSQSLQSGDKVRALELAREAQRLRPTAKWVLLELLELEMDAGHWHQALSTLDQAERCGALNPDVANPIRTQLAVNQARRLQESGKAAAALKLVQKAAKADLDNMDALALKAELLQETGKTRKAEKLIEDHWHRAATSRIAEVYANLAPPTSTVLDQVKRFEILLAKAPDAPESHIALAKASLDASLWGEARTHLQTATDLLGEALPARLCRLWARLEEAEHGNMNAAHAWLMQATQEDGNPHTQAPRSPLPALPRETLPV